jgi:hypothetical protein
VGLAEISDYTGNRKETEDSKSVPVGCQNEPPVAIGPQTQPSEPIGERNRIRSLDPEKVRLCWSMEKQGRSGKVWWAENRGEWERSRRHAMEDEEAEVAREAETAGWRVRTDECPERAKFVPR